MNSQTWTKVGANRSSRLTASQDFLMLTPKAPKCPLVSLRAICLAYILSQMDLQMCATFGVNRSSRMRASVYFWICDPLTPLSEMPPGILRGDLYLGYVHSQMNPQTWTKVGANRTASQYVWIVDPPKPPSATVVSRGAICLAYINSHMKLHMCAKFGANRPSRLVAFPECVLRLVRLFAAVRADSRKNTPKNNI